MTELTNRYDFVYFFDVSNGNPNGDPDAGNLPRMDPETAHGLVTDVALKRKIRNYVSLTKDEEDRFAIYMAERAVLNHQHGKAYDALSMEQNKKLPKEKEKAQELTTWMCNHFFDIRTFGAVMTTEVNAGQVRGPMQFSFARSVEPIMPIEISITRSSVTNEKDIAKERTMGRKHIVPYGLYRMHGYVNARLARKTGFSVEDLDLVWSALRDMFEHDRSAVRGEMTARRGIAFRHDSDLGNAQAHKLFERVTVSRIRNGEAHEVGSLSTHNWPSSRAFSDYRIDVDAADMPNGVSILELF